MTSDEQPGGTDNPSCTPRRHDLVRFGCCSSQHDCCNRITREGSSTRVQVLVPARQTEPGPRYVARAQMHVAAGRCSHQAR
jgi:hypothetical protein